MIPSQTFEQYPIFGGNATKVEPGDAKKSAGFQQADVLPAEWMNWAWNKNSKGISDLNAGVTSLEKEVNNVLAEAHISPSSDTNVNDQLYKAIRQNCGCIVTTSTTITNAPSIVSGNVVKVMFTQDIAGTDTTTGFLLSYNGSSYPVKVYKDGVLANFTAAKVSWLESSAVYKFLDGGTVLELIFDTTEFIIINDPVVLKSSRYAIHADGSVEGGAIGDVKPIALVSIPYGWLECDGSAKSRTEFAKLFNFFSNEKYDSSHTLLSRYGTGNGSTTFNLPDYREVALVGAGQNGKDSIATHDVYTVGQFGDDCFQDHLHDMSSTNGATPFAPVKAFQYGSSGRFVEGAGSWESNSWSVLKVEGVSSGSSYRPNSVTHGKQKGVKYIIKVL